jgi:hypothetical protein
MMAEMLGRHSGERSGSVDPAAITVLIRAIASVLLMAGLLLRFGALCPDDVFHGEAASVHGVRAAPGPTNITPAYAGHGDDHDCHHQPEHARFVALIASAFLFALAVSPVSSPGCRRRRRSRAFIVRAIPRAPPARHIVFCVQLV